MRRVRGEGDRMKILRHKWHRRDVDGRAAASEAQNLRVIGKPDIELARGDHLSDHHLSTAIVEILARQALEKLSAPFFAHDFEHGGIPGVLSFRKADLAFPSRLQ